MGMAADFADMLPSTVTVERFTGENDLFADRNYAAPVTYRCYIDHRQRTILKRDGSTVQSRATIYLATTDSIESRDRITMPATFDPTQPPIVEVQHLSDELGPYAVVVMV